MTKVARRKVFYIPGYDPFPARRYRELYRKEGRKQAGIAGYDLDLKRQPGHGPTMWQVEALIDGDTVTTDVEVLMWSDIVKRSMSGSIVATYGQILSTAWTYCSTGVLPRLFRLRRGPVIAALYPIGMLLGQALLLLALGLLLAAILRVGVPDHIPVWPMQWAIVLMILGFGALWFRDLDGRLFAYYLMNDYAFSARSGGALPPELDARLSEFQGLIAGDLRSGAYDEVLVVGHSSGAHMAIVAVARLLREDPQPTGLSLLTLGQVVPMVSFLPHAGWLRGALADLSVQTSIPWVDVTAPGDGCSFALCDPVAVSGVASEGQRWPLVLTAAFSQTLAPETLEALKWRFFRLHFQYLCAFDDPSRFDYFATTAGPLSLWERFKDRSPAVSRITTPLSGYTGIDP